MSASEMGRGMEEKGREDMEEGIAPDVNMNDEETKAEANDNSFLVSENNQDAKASENVDLPTENNDVTSVGLLTDKDGSIDNQTADDANINSTVDRLDGNGKYLNLESVDNKDKGLESVSDKTDNNASVDVIFKEHFCSKSDGSLLIAADKTLAEMEVTNGEKEEKLDDASVVVASVNELSGTKDDGGHVRNKRECAAAERSPDIKAENDEMVGKFDAASVVDASADQLSGSKSDGSLVDPLNQLECAASDERPSEIKAVDDLKSEKLHDASFVDVANMLSGSKNDGIGSHVHRFDPPECAAADERLSEMKAKNDEKGEKLDDASVFHLNANELSGIKNDGSHKNSLVNERSSETKDDDERGVKLNNGVTDMELTPERDDKESKPEVDVRFEVSKESSNLSFLFEPPVAEGDESGTEDEQAAFAKEVENFYKERNIEFKHPKFYKEDLNLLKLWRAVIKLGGYDEVTSCKLWRQVGESFNPPKTCTTVSWTFRIFYEKALLEYEKHRISNGELPLRDCSHTEPSRMESQAAGSQALGSGRARRDAAARAMQGWHSKRLLGSGEVCHPIIKEKNSSCTPKNDRQIKNIGLLKRKKPSTVERTIQVAKMKGANSQLDTMIIDIGPPADWVKINVQRTIDCFEVYALVPGLLREEVHVQSDPAGRLVISGQPEQLDNPWGVTPFKKVVSLPSRIDPHQTSAVVTLHGQLFVRVPFEHSDM